MAAVRCIYSYPLESDSTPPSLLLPMHEPLVSYGYASRHDSIERAKVLAKDSSPCFSSHARTSISWRFTLYELARERHEYLES
jgi:hypothetical protein